jgi:hypothetical protein
MSSILEGSWALKFCHLQGSWKMLYSTNSSVWCSVETGHPSKSREPRGLWQDGGDTVSPAGWAGRGQLRF